METDIGNVPLTYIEKDGIYLFTDGTQFNKYTQNITFPPTVNPQKLEIKLLAPREKLFSHTGTDHFLHINISYEDYGVYANQFFTHSFGFQNYTKTHPSFYHYYDSTLVKEICKQLITSKFKLIWDIQFFGITKLSDSKGFISDSVQK